MKIVEHNPYRYLGIRADATAAEKLSAKNKIAAYHKIGKEVTTEFDFSPFLSPLIRTAELVDQKSNEILSDESRIISTLFWFLSDGKECEQAFKEIKSRAYDQALSSFKLGFPDGSLYSQNYINALNYSTLDIILFDGHKAENRLKLSLNLKLDLFLTKSLRSAFLQKLSISESQLNAEKIKLMIIDEIKSILQALFPTDDINEKFVEYFSHQQELVQDFNEGIAKSVVTKVKGIIAESIEKRKKSTDRYKKASSKNFGVLTRHMASTGENTVALVGPHLQKLKGLLGKSHPQTTSTCTTFLEEINYTGLDCFNILTDCVSSSTDSEKRELIRSIDVDQLERIIQMSKSALQKASDIPTSIASTLQDNVQEYEKWKEAIVNARTRAESGDGSGSIIGLLFRNWYVIFFLVYLLSKC